MNRFLFFLLFVCSLCFLNACGGSGGPGPIHFSVTTPANANAGTSFNNLTVTALDAANNPFTTYSGTVHFTSTDGHAALPANSVLANGTRTFTATFNTSGMQTITATDTVRPSITGVSNETQVCCVAPAGTFMPTGSMQTAREGHTATLLQDGTVLIAGGDNSTGFLASAEIYNPATGMFTPTAGNMETARFGHTATLLTNGNVLVAGGVQAAGVVASAEIYNPATGMFTPTAGNMETARAGHTATLLNDGTGRVLVAGGGLFGYNAFGPWDGAGQASAELFDPKSGQFTPAGNDMSAKRNSPAATLLSNGDVLLAGGTNTGGSALGDLFSPASAMFTATTNGGTTAVHLAATMLQDGSVLLTGGEFSVVVACGGIPREFWSSTKNALFFNIGDASFASAGDMSASRVSPTATLLPGGEVLIAGGAMGQANCELITTRFFPLASAELFSSASGTFTPTASMENPRAGHTATLLSNGKVLLVGGTSGGGAFLATAELFQ
jgi:Galactose oxidase, central domain